MKTIGMLGGMSWESTVSYYQALNKGVKERLGGLHSAKICLFSVDFAEIEAMQHAGRWDETAEVLSGAARAVERGGADFLIVCTNTMHKVADEVQSAIGIPLLHIADATAEELRSRGIAKVGLLGTRFTMEEDFYRGRLQDRHGIEVVLPGPRGREIVHRVIYSELCLGQISSASRQQFLEIIERLRDEGAEAVILGCTEIALLVQQEHTDVPLFDTTAIHARKAVELALGDVALPESR